MATRKIEVALLTAEQQYALQEKATEARLLLHIGLQSAPRVTVSAIGHFADGLCQQSLADAVRLDRALQLGALWGSAVIQTYRWRWRLLDFGQGMPAIYLVSPAHTWCCPPLAYFYRLLIAGHSFTARNHPILSLFDFLGTVKEEPEGQKYNLIGAAT